VRTDVGVDVGLFGPESVAWRIHADQSMLVGGFRALMLEALHPAVMAGFDMNSGFRDDPWGRLTRTGKWIATVTYGTTAEAHAAGESLRGLHARLRAGVEPETGRSFRVDDPDLLMWVHCTEVESFLSTFRRSGGRLAPGDADCYVNEMRRSAEMAGLDPEQVPRTERAILDYYEQMRPQLRLSKLARQNVTWGLMPPMPVWATPVRPAWWAIVGLTVATLPRWARRLYSLPGLPTTDLAASVASAGLRRTMQLLLPHGGESAPAHRAALARVATASTA
jgi:uncharacterized protein (DUF2236 family)